MNIQGEKKVYIGKNSIGTEQGNSGKSVCVSVCLCVCVSVCVSVCVLEYFYILLKKNQTNIFFPLRKRKIRV